MSGWQPGGAPGGPAGGQPGGPAAATPRRRAWTDADSALWHTARILRSVAAGRLPEERVATLFALRPGEVAFVAATFQLDSMRPLRDGGSAPYATPASASASDTLGLARAGTWRPDFGGALTVTNLGFYLVTPAGTFWWDWASIDLMQVTAFNTVVLQGRSDRGVVTWRIYSLWAELIFVLWAQARHPNHPQLADGGWLPEHWAEWAARQGYPPPLPERTGG